MVGFPLLLIPLAVFNIIAFLMPDVAMTAVLFRLHLMSGTEWSVTLSDVLLMLGMLLLLLEVIKGARPGAKFLMDHLLSLIVFGAAAAEFVLWPKFGNSTFFLLTLLALVDFLGGVALRVRRSVQYALVPVDAPRGRKRGAPADEPRTEPAAVPAKDSRPAAASVAESVLSDQPTLKPVAPAPTEGSPQVISPNLQPSGNTPEQPQR